MADAIVARTCMAQQLLVQRDARFAEREEKWLAAAHLYAYLATYGSELCGSEEVIERSWNLPLVEVLLRARWGKPEELDRQTFLNSYLANMKQADGSPEEIESTGNPREPLASHQPPH
jgi:hypothetical protein